MKKKKGYILEVITTIEEITMKDNQRLVFIDDRDILETIEEYCGYDFMKCVSRWYEDVQEDTEALKDEARSYCEDWEYLRDCILEISNLIDDRVKDLESNKKISRKQMITMLIGIKKYIQGVL